MPSLRRSLTAGLHADVRGDAVPDLVWPRVESGVALGRAGILNLTMSNSQDQIRGALEEFQNEKKYFSVAVYRIAGDYAVRVASAGSFCSQCDKVHRSTGNIGRVARSGVAHSVDDISKDPSYRSCFSQVQAEAVVPVLASGKTVGIIDAESCSGPIDPAELEVLAKRIEGFLEVAYARG